MDLSTKVNYELEIPVTIHEDDDGAVIFYVRSIENSDAQKMQSKVRAKAMGKRVSTDGDNEDGIAEILSSMIDPSPEVLATCVTKWEWNGHEFGKLGKDPKYSAENVAATLQYKWIKDKVQGTAQNIENFTQA